MSLPEDLYPRSLEPIFRDAHRRLKPRTTVPEIEVEFFPFAGLTHTARFRQDRLLIRISDALADAPKPVMESLAVLLLGKLYRRRASPADQALYREFILRGEIQARARALRRTRGRRPPAETQGRWRTLETAFDKVNREYFEGNLRRPRLSWSATASRRHLGRYDVSHDIIVVSRVFDSPRVPEFVLEYILYHEMLHIKHPTRVQDCRLLSHTPEFRADERRFSRFEEASEWCRKL